MLKIIKINHKLLFTIKTITIYFNRGGGESTRETKMADEGRHVAEYDDAEQDEDEEDGEEEGSDDEGELDADGEDDGAPTGNGRPSVAEVSFQS